MIKAKTLVNLLKKNNINFFSGVPDSILKELSFLLENKKKQKHIIATNEGSAVSIGIGHYLSTKRIPAIYMQNSGLSNALNPLISIAHKNVYSIPLILIIGWRGSPKLKDEPQHNVKGKITESLLKLLKIKYTIIRSDPDLKSFNKLIRLAKKNKIVVACLIEQGTLEKNKLIKKKKEPNYIVKEDFLKKLLYKLNNKTRIISSTGYNSRELLLLREKYNIHKSKDFYMVGGMGHTLSVALGFSLFNKSNTICIDGDGSLLMHLGSLMSAGTFANKNLKYILLNNNTHDSVGGQNTFSNNINFEKLSKSLGFKRYYSIKNKKYLNKILIKFINEKYLSFLEVKIKNSKNNKLPRPKNLINIKNQFMR